VGTLLEDASTNLVLLLLPSRKIHKTHQKNIVKYALGSGIQKCTGGSWGELTFLPFLVLVVFFLAMVLELPTPLQSKNQELHMFVFNDLAP
jgi:hypothetical protein